MERELQRLSWQSVQGLVPHKITTVILPIGTLEAHGSACLGTDNIIPETIARDIAERINVLIAPTVNHGVTKSLMGYPGGTTIKPATFAAYVRDILDSLVDTGFTRIIVMNGHGGNNEALKATAFEFYRARKVKIMIVHWWQLVQQATEAFFGHLGGHAGTDEVAMVMAVDPALAGQDQYSHDLAYQMKPGADIFPAAGSILLYRENEGYPEFDQAKAKEYRAIVANEVGAFCESILARWDTFGL
jgi:creatinine amidohydrolase